MDFKIEEMNYELGEEYEERGYDIWGSVDGVFITVMEGLTKEDIKRLKKTIGIFLNE